jgi:hypothetical protein
MKKGCAAVVLFYALLALAFACKTFSNAPSMTESDPAPSLSQAISMPAAVSGASGPAVTLRAASGATILFKTQNGQEIDGVAPQPLHLPHLVLHRNGALTDPAERTLIVEVTGITVPPPGVTVTLEIETQHEDPDLRDGSSQRIIVWHESSWIANTSDICQTGVTAVFTHEFGETVVSDGEPITTPTDYFRYEIAVVEAGHPAAGPQQSFSADHACLLEDQSIAPLPEVQETTPGAAPDELVVYYCDMFPFRQTNFDPTTWLSRGSISHYVNTELVPGMTRAFSLQSDGWGFPWHDAWTSFRVGEDTERLSVALSDGRMWFHGFAPSKAHAEISIMVTGSINVDYDTLTDGILSTFHHELFHNLQRNINLNSGGDGDVDGQGDAWQFFSEGTAVLASSVRQPAAQFAQAFGEPTYVLNTNRFLGNDSLPGDLNTGYGRIFPNHAAVYWRFLYEQCGGMRGGIENPAAGMAIIRRVLTVLYSGDIVDISASTNLVGAMHGIMDQALAGSACPFQTYEESLLAFARAIYALRLEGGRCTAPGTPDGCGFYDPNNQYLYPPLSTITYAGIDQQYADEIGGSYGVDFVDVVLDPAAAGQSLTLEFYPAPGADATFNVQIWQLVDSGPGAKPRRIPSQVVPAVLTGANADGHLSHDIPAIDTTVTNRLGLIVTRVDARESSDPVGAYTIVLRAEG